TNRLSAINIKIENNITNALGSFSLSLMQLTSIYNALANNGIYTSPRFYNEYSINGKSYYTGSKSLRLFDEEKSRIMSYMLLSTQDKALKTYATPTMLYNQTSKRFGVKTGSTDSSSFVIGYNPMYTIGVYVGTDDNSKLYQTNISKIVFRPIADKLMEHKKDVYYSTNNLEPFVLYNSKAETKSFTYYK
ncbi:MAG TPA: hypothetical protein DCY93_00540, partial [Firmicutes bacterium]|nr:hypothetical protein [Bacillota bacterium]